MSHPEKLWVARLVSLNIPELVMLGFNADKKHAIRYAELWRKELDLTVSIED